MLKATMLLQLLLLLQADSSRLTVPQERRQRDQKVSILHLEHLQQTHRPHDPLISSTPLRIPLSNDLAHTRLVPASEFQSCG